MEVCKCFVAVQVSVSCAGWNRRVMRVLMVCVMSVHVFMLHRCMDMSVLVPLGNVQPHTQPHQHACGNQLDGDSLIQ